MNPALAAPPLSAAPLDEILETAIATKQPLRILYAKPDEAASERIVSPSEVWEAKDSSLILSAFDHGRDEPRSFRLDRIEDAITVDDVEFVEMPTND